ncbi:PREDICTED: putative F-box/FBD/LRR-repeat protein At1g78840 isoform X1 [Camelina sativa]|uniref:F-box/FBD/LRR-repeat protein At1g78840 isoform X1 n=1 Tax=Camelina sativa TaxID=90675 RepID=A0ABM0TQH1_CAMSA|nr:PREDICTED: putative F-box/FBD/LRR-repeat protein At1g78840 isoform X1 [Camelina sativa]XP_010429725.1 PREDICTED: putative F-box/FBD/LRR-repeat protein At1g78840 isoform X1 [Camelina sativa]XP_010429726.1 PREDICTED: putative F-box/FBD/LRR-repeat protein At1g78840 isoform X1 [Camelina sativa]XP_010429727.1 PREDICTED: putative F-box/FBD/LRR-repeat protein At1g78840 isoform X1 [Camelina sativa]XP_010429728.1 PREDICTED: putative F-box/FBD/LRR-repeat protein At1g78840 isoform X1 [Camelina sativa]
MDLISQLPEDLLHQILLKLDTTGSVRTSVLSTRWRYLWQRVPGLDLYLFVFRDNGLKGFVNRFLDLDKEKPLINQFKLVFDGGQYETEGSNFINKWVNSVVARGVQHLVLFAYYMASYYRKNDCPIIKLPGSISMCETLVHLELVNLGIHSFDSVSLPRLETMHFKSVWFSSDAALERLISSSPLLRDLNIDKIWNVEFLRVRSQTLSSLNLNVPGRITGVAIDAPRLKRLSLEFPHFIDLVLNSVSSPIRVCFNNFSLIESDFNSSTMKTLPTYLAWISKVKNLSLNCSTLKAMCAYSRPQPLPEFSNLTHLKVSFSNSVSVIELLATFLASCPNLKSLQLSICGKLYKVDTSRSHAPKCLLTSLEIVEIYSTAGGTELVKYILGNAAVLKELNLKFPVWEGAKYRLQFVEKILLLPKRSSVCQVSAHTAHEVFL